LLRHAHAEWHEDDGRPWSGDSLKAAHLVAARLAGRPTTAVYTSPSTRSIQTVEPLVLATHGTLLALVLNALDRQFADEFWRRLSFPDIYQLTFADAELRRVERLWDAA
jgi:broad specificity phosphatase PhoE